MSETVILAILGSGAVSALISGIFNLVERRREKDDAIQLMLYHDIKAECREYIAEGSIDSESLEVLIKMHDTYHKRGGNGYLDKMMADVKKLPVTA